MPKSRSAGGGQRDIAAIDDDRTGILVVQPGNGPQQRCLATAGGTKEADEFAAHHIEIDAVQRLEGTERLAELANREKRLWPFCFGFHAG